MHSFSKDKERGFTLIELLIAMALALVIIAALSSAFVSHRKTYAVQEQVSEMVQNARAAMDMITREVKMAGYAPTGYDKKFEDGTSAQTTPPPYLMQRKDPTGSRFVGIPYDTAQLQIIADLNGDGQTDGDNEKITYKYYDTTDYPKQIKRKTSDTGTFQPLAENIQSFTFEYLKKDGVTPATAAADIREIKITIEAKTAQEDPNYTHPTYNNGYRTYTLSSFITPPNLAL